MPNEYDVSTLPGWELKYFLRWVARATEAYFKDPDVQRRFKEWQEEERRKAEAEAAQTEASPSEAVPS